MHLKDLFEIYLLKREVWEGEKLNKSENIPSENMGKKTQKLLEILNKPIEAFTTVEVPNEGDVIEIVPSVDGLPLLFIVWDVDYELGEVRLVPLTEFYQFATDKDLLIELQPIKGLPKNEDIHGKIWMAQPTLYVSVPLDRFVYWFDNRVVYKVGKVPREVLENLHLIYQGQVKGSGNMSGGIKEKFKREEAQRYAILQSEIWEAEIKTTELNESLSKLREELPIALAADQMPYRGLGRGFIWEYDSERQILFVVPMDEEIIGRNARLVLELPKGKQVFLWEGILWKGRVPIPIDKDNFRGDIFQRFLKIEVEE